MPMIFNTFIPPHREARIKRYQILPSSKSDKVCFPLRGSSEGEMKSKSFQKKTLPYFMDKSQRK